MPNSEKYYYIDEIDSEQTFRDRNAVTADELADELTRLACDLNRLAEAVRRSND